METKLFDIIISTLTKEETLKYIYFWLYNNEKGYITTVNPEFLLLSQKDKEFKNILQNSKLNTADGIGLIWASWFLSTTKKAKNFLGLTIYLHKKFLNILESDVDMDNNTFIEFRIFDKDNNFIGIVTDIDTSTQNVLFIVDNGEKQILIPACQDYILQIDEMKKIIYMDLPEGLLEL